MVMIVYYAGLGVFWLGFWIGLVQQRLWSRNVQLLFAAVVHERRVFCVLKLLNDRTTAGNRSNVVARVMPESPAAKAGLKKGDVVRQLGNVPIHSFGDATFALDQAPTSGRNVVMERIGQLAISAPRRRT